MATTDNAYLTLKNWAENTVTDPEANPAPEALAKANGAVLTSAALGSEKVLTSDDVAVTAMEVGAEGATTLAVKFRAPTRRKWRSRSLTDYAGAVRRRCWLPLFF